MVGFFKRGRIGVGVALAVLLIALLSRMPVQSCHCLDPKSAFDLRESCPFGKLRILSGSFLLALPSLLPLSLVMVRDIVTVTTGGRWVEIALASERARGPPLAV